MVVRNMDKIISLMITAVMTVTSCSFKGENPLDGKRIAFIGDSISYGTNWQGGYGKLIGEQYNMNVTNVSKGGATLADNAHWSENSDGYRPYITDMLDNLDGDYEYIIAEGLLNHHLYKDQEDLHEKVMNALHEVGLLPEFASRFPHEFSGGQRQRIGIARALVMEPEFIVADEPISALDVSIRAQVLNLLNEMKKSRGLTYLFIAHDLSVVRFISDRIAVISKGRIVELAEAEELFLHPLHPYTKALLSAVPIPDPSLEKHKKLLVYDPSIHDYSVDKPVWEEIANGHFVYGNQRELEGYRKEYESQL